MKEEIINIILKYVDDEAMYLGDEIHAQTWETPAEYKEIYVQDVKEHFKKYVEENEFTLDWLCELVDDLGSGFSDQVQNALEIIGAI